MEKSDRQACPKAFALDRIETSVAGSEPAKAGAKGLSKPAEEQGWIDFRDQCRRQMGRSLDQRIKYGFCRMYKPVLDDAPWRSFDTMAEYRAWCAEHLPDYLGFKPAKR